VMAAGIDVRHARGCRTRNGQRCNCDPNYQAHVWSNRDGKRIRKTFASEAAAKGWRQDVQVALREGRTRAPAKTTLSEAATEWLRGAKRDEIRNRSGDPYKPSVLRTYERSLKQRALPELGAEGWPTFTAATSSDS
jgi:integrase